MRRVTLSLLSCCLLLTDCSSSTTFPTLAKDTPYTKPRTLTNFNDYVLFLKKKAASEGVSSDVLQAQHNIQYIENAVKLDHKQAGKKRQPNTPPFQPNPNGVSRYLNKVLTQQKVELAKRYEQQYQTPLQQASRQYGVPKEYLLALWGMESGFGRNQGKYDVLSVLATLAFEGRRETLFTQEFINAMKMLQNNTLPRQKMRGSWAGAMGQTQFMPTAYLNYAADGDHDNKKDIWQNHYDVFASIASYLSTVGWDKNLPWGVEVTLAQPIDLQLSGLNPNQSRQLAQWQSLGVMLRFPTPQAQHQWQKLQHTPLWLVRPDQEKGRAFLVSQNFKTLLDWNRSNNFAISIGKFADKIALSLE